MSDPESALISEIRAWKGDRSHVAAAQELGTSEGMIRALLTRETRPGMDTIARLLVVDPDRFEPIVLAYLRERGAREST